MIKKLDKHLVLVGMMASGKSTIGKNMSEALNTFFYDIDYLVEKSENKTIAELFKTKGEEYFRELEYEKTREILNKTTPSIISLGGGAFINPRVRDIMKDTTTVWLKVDISEIIKRVKLNNNRPLLSGKNDEEIGKIYIEREKYYSMAKIHFNCNNKSIKTCITEILTIIEDH